LRTSFSRVLRALSGGHCPPDSPPCSQSAVARIDEASRRRVNIDGSGQTLWLPAGGATAHIAAGVWPFVNERLM